MAGCRTCQATAALEQYTGPSCFAIPGNHDWIDGLETYQRHIQHRGWLGGKPDCQAPQPMVVLVMASLNACESPIACMLLLL